MLESVELSSTNFHKQDHADLSKQARRDVINGKKCSLCTVRNSQVFCIECMNLGYLAHFCNKCKYMHGQNRTHKGQFIEI